MKRQTGRYVTHTTAGERCQAFVPAPLPPKPDISISLALQKLLEEATLSLGQLDGLSTLLPDTGVFIYMYVRKEAVISSQIEGTQSSLSQLLLFEIEEAPGVPLDDVQEVSNYVAALEHGLKRLREGFPLSLRLIREIHAMLLRRGRGSVKNPGEFRRSQNWIGGTRPGNAVYVPPPPDRLMECLDAFERFLHADSPSYPVLIKAAMAHVQFETIHPFLDGNGRLGRLLITLLLCAGNALNQPLLYLSLFFKTHRQLYYQFLQKVRTEGDWETWIEFFIEGVKTTSGQAVKTARDILSLFESDGERILRGSGRAHATTLMVFRAMQQRPLSSIKKIVSITGLVTNTVAASLDRLQKMSIVVELTGRKRNRLFAYRDYLAILEQGTEPL